mmetsp:Transcript_750/g.2699  ORF Transcript_750/g.2699 Transcript_750/m.2699 type:complete len:420 (+) Transcript_750:48-1307(+)
MRLYLLLPLYAITAAAIATAFVYVPDLWTIFKHSELAPFKFRAAMTTVTVTLVTVTVRSNAPKSLLVAWAFTLMVSWLLGIGFQWKTYTISLFLIAYLDLVLKGEYNFVGQYPVKVYMTSSSGMAHSCQPNTAEAAEHWALVFDVNRAMLEHDPDGSELPYTGPENIHLLHVKFFETGQLESSFELRTATSLRTSFDSFRFICSTTEDQIARLVSTHCSFSCRRPECDDAELWEDVPLVLNDNTTLERYRHRSRTDRGMAPFNNCQDFCVYAAYFLTNGATRTYMISCLRPRLMHLAAFVALVVSVIWWYYSEALFRDFDFCFLLLLIVDYWQFTRMYVRRPNPLKYQVIGCVITVGLNAILTVPLYFLGAYDFSLALTFTFMSLGLYLWMRLLCLKQVGWFGLPAVLYEIRGHQLPSP